MNNLEFLFISILTVFLFCGTIYILTKNKFNPVGYLFGFLALICLKQITDSVLMHMIDIITLFQIDATIIAGALVLLTITSFVGKTDHEPIGVPFGKKRKLAFTPHQVAGGSIGAFALSALFIMVNSQEMAYFSAGAGFVWLIICAIVITGKEQFDSSKSNKSI